MTESPISDFLARGETFKPIDVAVLFAMIAYAEKSFRGLISPSVRGRLWPVDASPDELSQAMDRLIDAGEVVWFDDGKEQGYLVSRRKEFLDLITDFGGRRYARLKAQESRDRQHLKTK